MRLWGRQRAPRVVCGQGRTPNKASVSTHTPKIHACSMLPVCPAAGPPTPLVPLWCVVGLQLPFVEGKACVFLFPCLFLRPLKALTAALLWHHGPNQGLGDTTTPWMTPSRPQREAGRALSLHPISAQGRAARKCPGFLFQGLKHDAHPFPPTPAHPFHSFRPHHCPV